MRYPADENKSVRARVRMDMEGKADFLSKKHSEVKF
jgi:hypothetical protein